MKTVRTIERTGKDGVLHLSFPLGTPEAEYEVLVVIVQPQTRPAEPSAPEDLGWPPGYFESTFGSITDETFVRHPQGELPKPLDLE